MTKGSAVPLGFLEVGRQAVIKDIIGGSNFRRKLSEMGFAMGMKINNIRNDGSGPIIVGLMESRIVLGRGMAQKIMVEEIC